jgi:hypothetical protein
MFKRIPIKRGFPQIEKLWYELEEVNKKLEYPGVYILGGYARYCCSPRDSTPIATDIDIYCHNEKAFEEADYMLHNSCKLKDENPNAKTYEGEYLTEIPVQLIKPQTNGAIVTEGSIENILSNFDFSVVRAAIVSPTECVVDEDFEEHETKKLLVIKNIHCPISSMYRCIKYCKKGYWLKVSEATKLFEDWMNRDNEYREYILNTIAKSLDDGLSEEEVFELERLMRID